MKRKVGITSLWLLIGALLLLLFFVYLSGCAYRSEIIFDEAGNKATLKSNTKSNAEINLKEKKAKIEQLDEPWW